MNLLDDQSNDDNFDPNAPLPEKYLERFKDVEKDEVVKEKFKTDMYVESLTRNLDQMREDFTKLRDEYTARASLQEMVDQLSRERQLASNENNLNVNEVNEKPEFDLTKIKETIRNELTETRKQEKEMANYDQVKAKLQERYGRHYVNVLKEQQETLGLSDEYVNSLAMSSPKAFFKLMGLDETPRDDSKFESPPRSQSRSDSFMPRVAEKRTWSYYEKMRKEKPDVYYSPKTQVQMHQDHQSLGKEFEDGSWG